MDLWDLPQLAPASAPSCMCYAVGEAYVKVCQLSSNDVMELADPMIVESREKVRSGSPRESGRITKTGRGQYRAYEHLVAPGRVLSVGSSTARLLFHAHSSTRDRCYLDGATRPLLAFLLVGVNVASVSVYQ